MSLNLRDLALVGQAAANAYDAEVLDWVARAIANGGTVSQGTKDAANTFMLSVKAVSGLRAKILRLNLFAGDRLASLVPLVKDAGSATDNAFVASTYSEALGWSMTNPSEYISTGLNPSVSLTTNSAHLAFYMGGTAGQNTWIPIGTVGDGLNQFFLLGAYTGVGSGGSIWASPYPTAADTDGRGFYLASRTSGSSNGVKLYRNGSVTATSSSVGGSPPNSVLFVMNSESAGVALGGAPSNKYGRGYQFGTGVTDSDTTSLNSAWQTFQTALSRQV